MIYKLISKQQVRLLEYEGNPSQDYKDGYCRAIHDVIELETIPTLGVDELKRLKEEIQQLQTYVLFKGDTKKVELSDVLELIDLYIKGE